MKRFLSILLAVTMLSLLLPVLTLGVGAEESNTEGATQESVTVTSGDYSLTVNKTQFDVGEEILISATGSGKDFVGIYASNGETSIYWDYVTTHGSGVAYDIKSATNRGNGYTSELSSIPEGRYVVRLIPNDGGITNTVCHVVITVGNPNIVEGDSTLMQLEKSVYTLGEKVTVSGKISNNNKDWIGIYKLNVHNTTYSNMWKYIANVGEDVAFDVTSGVALPVGDYLLCHIENDMSKPANATAWAIISVKDEADEGSDGSQDSDNTGDTGDTGGQTGEDFGDTSLIVLEKKEFAHGEPIMVAINGTGTDWVGIYDDADDLIANKWHYASTAGAGVPYDILQGTVIDPGTYLIRFVPDNSGDLADTLAGVYITVTDEEYVSPDDGSGDTEEIKPFISVEKTEFKVGEPITVYATGSGKDWVGLFQGNSYLNNAWYYIDTAQSGGVGSGIEHDVTNGNTIPAGEYTLAIVANGSSNISDAYMTIPITVLEETGADIEAPLSATYTLANNNDGYATGTVTVTMGNDNLDNRSIVMYWANANGRLEGYTAHSRFKVTGETTTFTFGKSVIIPKGATCLHIHSQSTDLGTVSDSYVTVELPENASMEITDNVITSFFIVSDIHITSSLTDTHATNFKKMIAEAIALNPNGAGIFIVGDLADNGTEAQYENMMALYNSVLSENGKSAQNYPLYLATGNHDFSGLTFDEANALFLKYATLPNGENPTDTSYDFWLNGYHYIFLGTDVSAGLYNSMNSETLAWLDEKLAECRDESRPTFVFLHQPMSNTVSGSLEGEGWDGVVNEDALREVLKKYPEVMMFNGHTHWTMDSVGNIYEGTDELPIHIFNCASVGYLWSGYNKVTGESLAGSQGYYIEIYDGKIMVRGRDFASGSWIPAAQYCIELAEGSDSNGHSYVESLKYENGYMSNGILTSKCSICNSEQITEVKPIFIFNGYSISTFNTSSICVGYVINFELLEKYEALNNTEILVGFVANPYDYLVQGSEGKPINSDGTTAELTGGNIVNYVITETHNYVNLILKSSDWEKYKDHKTTLCLYIIENGNVGYICNTSEITDTASYITYSAIKSSVTE